MSGQTWYCHWCHRNIDSFGLANHRAMHRRHKDGPVKMESFRYIETFDYREEQGQ